MRGRSEITHDGLRRALMRAAAYTACTHCEHWPRGRRRTVESGSWRHIPHHRDTTHSREIRSAHRTHTAAVNSHRNKQPQHLYSFFIATPHYYYYNYYSAVLFLVYTTHHT